VSRIRARPARPASDSGREPSIQASQAYKPSGLVPATCLPYCL